MWQMYSAKQGELSNLGNGVTCRWFSLDTADILDCVVILVSLSTNHNDLRTPVAVVSMKQIVCTAFEDGIANAVENFNQQGTIFKYDCSELLQIWNSIKGKVIYKTLHPLAVANIRKYRIFKSGRNKRWQTSEKKFKNRQAHLENLLPWSYL